MRYGLIMAGGAGTRLWPLSRKDRPKQLIPLVRGRTLLQLSWERLRTILPPERIYVCTRADYAEGVRANLPELPADNMLGEPEGRDTANAVGFGAAVMRRADPDAVVAVMTADHVIEPLDAFRQALDLGFEVVDQQPRALVTFGIVPTEPHTGLGYIHRGEAAGVPSGRAGVHRVREFKEKPDKATADRYLESGEYYWNSGMFVWRADTVLDELAMHLPECHKGVTAVAEAWATPRRQTVLADVYPRLPRISIDYAVMEPASRGRGRAQVFTVEMSVDWLDIGSWPALAETLAVDEHDNATDAELCVLLDCDDNIIVSRDPEHLLAAAGLSDMIIVHTRDVTMICPRRDAQKVKSLVELVQRQTGARFI